MNKVSEEVLELATELHHETYPRIYEILEEHLHRLEEAAYERGYEDAKAVYAQSPACPD